MLFHLKLEMLLFEQIRVIIRANLFSHESESLLELIRMPKTYDSVDFFLFKSKSLNWSVFAFTW